MTDDTFTNKSQQRLMAMMGLMAGHESIGIRPGELAEKLQVSAATITRDLRNMQQAGFAEPAPGNTGGWRLSANMVAISHRVARHIHEQQQQLDELRASYGQA